MPRKARKWPRVVLVASGKGGVGKTTIAIGLAQALAADGRRVGLLDCDLESPTMALMGSVSEAVVGEGILEARESHGVFGDSIGTRLPADAPVVWDEPLKSRFIRSFVAYDHNWRGFDYLIIDLPPNASAELTALLSVDGSAKGVLPFRRQLHGAVVVTEPTEASLASVNRTVSLLRMAEVPIIGIVENKSGEVLGAGGGERLAALRGVPFLGSIPLDAEIRMAADDGRVLPEEHFRGVARAVREFGKKEEQ